MVKMGRRALGILLLVGGGFVPLLFFPLALRFPFNRSIMPILIGVMITMMIIGGVLLAVTQPKLGEKRMEAIDRQFPCPVCKKDVFTWGKVPSAVIRLRIGLGQPTWARVCNYCGNVQQFTKTD